MWLCLSIATNNVKLSIQNDNACLLLNRYLRNNNISRISEKTFEWNRNLWYLYVQITINVFAIVALKISNMHRYQLLQNWQSWGCVIDTVNYLCFLCSKKKKNTSFLILRIWSSSIPCLCESSRMNSEIFWTRYAILVLHIYKILKKSINQSIKSKTGHEIWNLNAKCTLTFDSCTLQGPAIL